MRYKIDIKQEWTEKVNSIYYVNMYNIYLKERALIYAIDNKEQFEYFRYSFLSQAKENFDSYDLVLMYPKKFGKEQSVAKTAKDNGVKALSVKIKGFGPGKDAALRQFQASDFSISEIKNVTPLPHNGVRKPKKFGRR